MGDIVSVNPVEVTSTTDKRPRNKVLGALETFATGMNAGHGIAEGIAKGVVKGKMRKAQTTLDKYLEGTQNGAIDTGEGGEGLPTTRDLLAAYNEEKASMEKWVGYIDDKEYREDAESRWATKLTKGYNGLVSQAINHAQAGNTDQAVAAAKRALALLPNGTSYDLTTTDGGLIKVVAKDEDTGDDLGSTEIDPLKLSEYLISADSPEEAVEVMRTQLDRKIARDSARAEAEQQRIENTFEEARINIEKAGLDIEGYNAITQRTGVLNTQEYRKALIKRLKESDELNHINTLIKEANSGNGGGQDVGDLNQASVQIENSIKNYIEQGNFDQFNLMGGREGLANAITATAQSLLIGEANGYYPAAVQRAIDLHTAALGGDEAAIGDIRELALYLINGVSGSGSAGGGGGSPTQGAAVAAAEDPNQAVVTQIADGLTQDAIAASRRQAAGVEQPPIPSTAIPNQ